MAHAPPYPLFVDLVQKPVLVVGGGSVGLRKTQGLVECAARVTVVSPEFAAGFDKIADIERIIAPYAATHMAHKMWRLVFAATNQPAVNAQVQMHASAAGILCCRTDEPQEGDFSSGANVRVGATRRSDGRGISAAADGGGLVLAVSTAGASPVLAARICRDAAAGIDPVLPALADLLSEWRTQVKAGLPDPHRRRILLQRLAGVEMETLLRREGAPAAQRVFREWLSAAQNGDAAPVLSATAGSAAPAPGRSSRAVKHAH
jgi:siroheme synthase (precorrin-2 oxidase/ferrochelatase)